MATSNVYGHNITKNQIIEDAAELAGIYDPEGQTLTASQYTRYTRALNNMITAWQADGLQIWTRRLGAVFLQKNKAVYDLGPSGDHASVDPVTTTFTSGAGASITVADTTGMTNGDNIGIEQSTGFMYWTTIATVDSATTLTLSVGGTDYLVGGQVWTYTTKLARPLRANDGYIRQTSGGNDTPLKILSEEEYMRFGMKTSTGLTTQIWYKPALVNGQLHCYPVPSSSNTIAYVEFHYPFQDFVSSGDNPDFPNEWLMAIVYGFAAHLGFSSGMDEKRLVMLEQKAKYWHDFALGTSQENSVFMQPDMTISYASH
jgi:hypothetical protein